MARHNPPRGSRENKARYQRSAAVQVRTREIEAEVVQRRLRGESFDAIAVALGMSTSAIHERYWTAIRRAPIAAVADLRTESMRRIDELRRKGWSRANVKRPPVSALQFLLALEDRIAKLCGLDAGQKYDGDTPIPQDADARVSELRSNLTEDELRQLISLMRKAKGLGEPVTYHPINVTPTGDPEVTASPPASAASVVETARQMVVGVTPAPRQTMSDDPEPPHYRTLAEYCASERQDAEDPLVNQFFELSLQKWSRWHARHCPDPKTCRHFKR